MSIDFSHKILYTWQVVGVGAGYIVKAFNHRLCPEWATQNGHIEHFEH